MGKPDHLWPGFRHRGFIPNRALGYKARGWVVPRILRAARLLDLLARFLPIRRLFFRLRVGRVFGTLWMRPRLINVLNFDRLFGHSRTPLSRLKTRLSDWCSGNRECPNTLPTG